jgi:hypothetical protein
MTVYSKQSYEDQDDGRILKAARKQQYIMFPAPIAFLNDELKATTNNFYVPNVTVVIFDRAIYTRETGKEEGWKLKNRRFGLGRVVRSPF